MYGLIEHIITNLALANRNATDEEICPCYRWKDSGIHTQRQSLGSTHNAKENEGRGGGASQEHLFFSGALPKIKTQKTKKNKKRIPL